MRNESSFNEKSFTELPRVFFSREMLRPSRNLPTEVRSLHQVPFVIIEWSEEGEYFYYLAQLRQEERERGEGEKREREKEEKSTYVGVNSFR